MLFGFDAVQLVILFIIILVVAILVAQQIGVKKEMAPMAVMGPQEAVTGADEPDIVAV